MKLRPYQQEAVNAVIQYLKTNTGNPIVSAATGTGKSVMIASLIKRIMDANNVVRVMVASHVAELLVQNASKLSILRPETVIRFYSAQLGKKDIDGDAVFAGIQSVYRETKIGFFNLLIIDEVHTLSRKDVSMWQTLIDKMTEINPKLRIIGFSATPFRLDSGSLTSGDDALFHDIVYDYGLGKAIDDGYLCSLSTKSTKTIYSIEGVGKIAGEFNLKELEAATNVDDLTRSAVAEMIERAQDRKSWLIFCNGVKHSFAVADELRRMGIVSETVTGETPDDERDRILEQFKSGQIKAVTNNAVWTTGVDIPNVDMIGMLRFTMSGGLLLQMAGRGTRVMCDLSPYETATQRRKAIKESTKPNCLFLDFAGNIKRHGFLDQIKGKDKKEKGEGVAPMKDCPMCAQILHAAARRCHECGYEFPENIVQKLDDAYEGQVISADESKEVIDVLYFAHNVKKEGKTPCLKVKYLHKDSSTDEYVLLEHSGYPKQKALKWWKDRGGGDISNMSVKVIVDMGMCAQLKKPSNILVGKDKGGKWDRVKDYDFTPKPVNALAEAEDISLF